MDKIKSTTSTSLRMLGFVWRTDRWLTTISIVAILIPAVVPFINIYIYKLVIDRVVQIAGGAPFQPLQFYPLIGIRLLTFFIQDAAFRTQRMMERLMWTKVPIAINQAVLSKTSSLDVHHFENDRFRDLLEKVRDSYEYRPQRLIGNLFFAMQSLLSLLIAFVALVRLNWIFILLIAVVAVPEFINQANRSKLNFGIWDEESPIKKKYYYLAGILQDQRQIKEIKLFRLANKFLKEIKSLQQGFYEKNKGLTVKSYREGLLFDGLSTVIFIGIEAYVIFLALSKKVTIGDISFYTGVVNNFQSSLAGLLRNLNEVYESSLYIQSIFEVLDVEPVIKEIDKPVVLSGKKPPVIEFRNVDFAYPGTSQKILIDFSLTINPGEKVAFVGENGAGKSTLIKLLVRFYDVDAGEILIDGHNIKDLKLDSWYQQIGVLFQDFNRYDYTAQENIHFGDINKELDLDEVKAASKLAGAHQMIEQYPEGYKQIFGKLFEGGIELSGGQWQKVALARAFFRNAPILVLDEPTAAIDAKAESEIFDRVEKLSRDKTVIIISHRFSTVRNADKIYVIDNGRVKESGSHQELMNLDGTYAQLFKIQAKGYQ